jgi:RHS repeat-associated protein
MLCAEDRKGKGFFSSEPGSQCGMIHSDHLGTPQKMTDASGQVVWAADYKPFGEATITVSTITNNLRFPGQYYDQETGLHYNYARDYSPVLDRYIEADPIGQRGGPNLYLYAGANSLRFTDPRGLLLGGNNATIVPPPGPVIGPPPGPVVGPQPPPPQPCVYGCHPGFSNPSPTSQCRRCTLDVGAFTACILREFAQAQDAAEYCTAICGIAAATRAPAAITACAICVGGGAALVTNCYNENCH